MERDRERGGRERKIEREREERWIDGESGREDEREEREGGGIGKRIKLLTILICQ